MKSPLRMTGWLAFLALLLEANCPTAEGVDTAAVNHRTAMQISSPAFPANGSIPVKYSCDGPNVSPPLSWTGVPSGAKSLVLIVDDPDAAGGTWVHWVLFDLPATIISLPEAQPRTQYLPGGAKQGLNDFQHLGYGGPCPPHAKPHRYFFKLYALDIELDLKPGASKQEVEKAFDGHVLAHCQSVGTYQRK